MIEELYKQSNETQIEYIYRVVSLKRAKEISITWKKLAEILNSQTGFNYNESTYRKWKLTNYADYDFKDESPSVFVQDVTRLINTLKRRVNREETIKQIAKECSDKISSRIIFQPSLKADKCSQNTCKQVACLLLSDWHYGISFDISINKYNVDIAQDRITKLKQDVCEWLNYHKGLIDELYIFNLGDLISGRIHNTIRIDNTIDVVTQTIRVSEILAEFIEDISTQTSLNIQYFDTLDNHSRIEPLKESSLDVESLQRFTHWFLTYRFSHIDSIQIVDNTFSDDIITTTILGHRVGAVHGDKDKQMQVVSNISMITRDVYDLICTAHMHHFSGDEQNECVVVSNSSLMGTDKFAQRLRLSSVPAQLMILITEKNPCREIIRFELD